jgi:manganese transport protein
VKKLLGITLGIMTALGGFVDLGQIVFTMQAGALFGYRLLWTVAVGTAAIIVYMEMCGRVAVVAREPVFAVIRNSLGKRVGIGVLVASNLLNLITCAAELGGIAILFQLLFGWPPRMGLTVVTLVIGALVFVLRLQWIERTFGLTGVVMAVFAATAYRLGPNWRAFAHGFLPSVPGTDSKQLLLYAYFAVGIFSAMLMEYEVHFYSSGALEEKWTPDDLGENFMVASLGSLFGAVLTAALLTLGAIVFLPRQIFPDTLGTTLLPAALTFGQKGLVLAMIGVIACLGGAAVETAMSGAYNYCQFFKVKWGKNLPKRSVKTFTGIWLAMLVVAFVCDLSGVRPLQLVNISVIFGMVVMPFTYYPILRAASDHAVMGKHINSRMDNIVGVAFLVLILIAAAAAIPLMIATHAGQP